ncbi:MAG: ABC transporter ATP-binding protein, partial [Hyphomicrobiales bacterium]
MSVLLEVTDLCIEGRPPGGYYAPIVKGVSLTVERGEVLAIIGESGSGKTTTALAALGYARPGCRIASGTVVLDGTDVTKLSAAERRDLRGRKVAYVAQSAAAAFNPALRIGDQVTEAAQIHNLMSRSEATERAVDLYRRLDLPAPDQIGKRYPHQVSGGQLQRLMAAMALSCGPELLVLDEPTTALDVTTQIEVLTAFKDIIRDQHMAAIYVTHDLAVVAQIADRIVVMYDGEIVERGATEDILHRPQHDYTKTLMAAVRPPPHLVTSEDEAAERERDPPVMEVKGLTAGYGRIAKMVVLRDVNIAIERGKVVGIIGESGCGKSTLARVMAGLLPQMDGEILHNGTALPPAARNRDKRDLQRIQIVFQMPDVAINPAHRVRDVLGRPLQHFLGLDAEARRARVAELLEMVELPAEFESRFPGELSGGQKQRVNLARALAAEPDIILCDEVTSALDTVVGAAIMALLKDLEARLGIANVFISHDLSTVASFADRIVVLYAGRVAEQGPTERVLSPPYHPYTR